MATRIQTIWQTVFDIVKTIQDEYSHPSKTKWVYSSFPDIKIEEKESYPIIVIYSPDLDQSEPTYDLTENSVSIDIEIYATSTASLDDLTDRVITKIESNRSTLEGAGLRVPVLKSMSTATYRRSGMKVHMRRMTYSFNLVYAR